MEKVVSSSKNVAEKASNRNSPQNIPFVPFELVGVTDFDNGVDGFSSIFLFDGVEAFDDVPDRGECGPSLSGCSIFLSSRPFSRGECVPPLLL